ncbi:uncharacterized protein LOC111707414 [Eurytemora carolleeae]|uniref:uncharacterized protein LOC111707414 n=1 Tax=Eurytemora carolleeae TaxID=1294199 RepID=UPI000C78CAC2|nr:uncharacterized protein LOC111707414 [Eurytemora carolleeae]|eukprot:XP_023336286.1 uncharacterized protein LOC111707414 [Eurytemora affinis]
MAVSCSQILRLCRLVILDILLSSVNLVLTFININQFLKSESTRSIGLFSLFLLWLPGIVASGGFVILYFRGKKAISKLLPWKLVSYPLTLLIFFPVLPVVLTVYSLIRKDDEHYQRARLARLVSSFLDHGPQFVVRVVVVVLSGLPHRGIYDKGDVVFIISMISSFLSLILSALVFNERKSSYVLWIFVCTPMFSAILASRAFTLAVFLRQVLQVEAPWYQQMICILVVVLMILSNIGLFRWCGQDWIRSVVFSLSSVLLPAGYNNDPEYYQLPNQNLLSNRSLVKPLPRLRRDVIETAELGSQVVTTGPEGEEGVNITEKEEFLEPMNSGKYLLSHILVNTVLLGTCSLYVYFSSKLDIKEDDALVLPQVLCAIPGLLFAIGRSFLHFHELTQYQDNGTLSERVSGSCQKGTKLAMAIIFTGLGFCSLIPAILWTLFFKFISSLLV